MNFLDEITKNKKETSAFPPFTILFLLKQNAYISSMLFRLFFFLLLCLLFSTLTSVASVDTLSKPFISSLHPHLLFPVVDPQKV